MSRDQISVHMSDLTEYVHRNGILSEDISGAASHHLAGHVAIPDTVFGDLGQESGLHGAVHDHIGRMHDHVHRVAGSVRDLGAAVHGAQGDYVANEDHHADTYRRILG
jgi:hypothetical protein